MIVENNILKISKSMQPPVTYELSSRIFLITATGCFDRISPVCSIFSNSIVKKINKK